MLDEEHAAPTGFTRHQTDANVYMWGRVGEHNIVIASLASGDYGTTSAATTASSLLASLPSIRVGHLVGIGGGIARPDDDHDIRLGDVVVSQPCGTTGGVCQYDLIKAKSGDKRELKGFLRRPPNNHEVEGQECNKRACFSLPGSTHGVEQLLFACRRLGPHPNAFRTTGGYGWDARIRRIKSEDAEGCALRSHCADESVQDLC
jgi:hypothetical protein